MHHDQNSRRAAILEQLGVLDQPVSALLRGIAALAAAICDRPISGVSVADSCDQHMMCAIGIDEGTYPLETSFCRHGLDGNGSVVVVPDARLDPRFRDSPAVTGDLGARSYAGAPIMAEGTPIGMVCVIGHEPADLSDEQRRSLSTLAELAGELLITRQLAADLQATLEQRDAARARQTEAEQHVQAMFAGIAVPLAITDLNAMIVHTNQAFANLTGTHVEPSTTALSSLFAESDRETERGLITEFRCGLRDSAVRELTLIGPDESYRPVLATSTLIRGQHGDPESVLTRVDDIALRRQAEVELRESQSALDGIITVDRRQRIVSWNDGAARLLGHDRASALGKHLTMVIPPDLRAAHERGFTRLNGGADPVLIGTTVELDALTADGSLLPIELSLSRWFRGDEPFYTAVLRDITERRRHEAEQRWLATHDPTTGLGNLSALQQWHSEHVTSDADTRYVAFFSLQLMNLDDITAALGSDTAKHALGCVGRAFAELNDDALEICHLGDTHFAGGAVVAQPWDPADAKSRLAEIAGRLAVAAGGPVVVHDVPIELQVQIGIVPATRTDIGFAEVLRQAEACRTLTPRRINIGSDTGGPVSQARCDLLLLSQLRAAVADGQLELHYQPVVSLQPARRAGLPAGRRRAASPAMAEALVRWRHPERGLIPPGQFIPLIENGPMISLVTQWVLAEALRQQLQWQADGLDVLIAVNLSAQVLLNDDVVTMIASALDGLGADAHRLKIEITESAIVADPDEARDVVRSLRRMGVLISLDDFGTGYTSLRLLRDLPVDEIKLDRIFVSNATSSPADAAIANAVSQLAHRLGIGTVAEGIEDNETRSLFQALGYDYIQGYLMSRPLPADDAAAWLRQYLAAAQAGDHRPARTLDGA